MKTSLEQSIATQRLTLNEVLADELRQTALSLVPHLQDVEQLDSELRALFANLEYCKYVYVLNPAGVQISSTINRYGADDEARGRDRSARPYVAHIHRPMPEAFKLSEAYISRNKKRPSLTAIQALFDAQGDCVGYLGVDFDIRDLPASEVMYEEPSQWRQIKGDPAIRQGLFTQERAESAMDQQIDTVLSVHEALMLDQGVHHFQIHFSSSRSIIWHVDDPFVYRLLTMEELSDSNICLAFPRRPYFKRAVVPPRAIGQILELFKGLRFADETVYLRSGSLNLVNGKIGLNFSCDGTHYLGFQEFIDKGLDFWFGGADFPQSTTNTQALELDLAKLDQVVETIAAQGCIRVNKLLYSYEKGKMPEAIQHLSNTEQRYVYHELKAVMDVYEGGVCGI